ncbi:MAG: archease [Chloroflexi bacterium]|nr:archease [Chloroflexota bacterium]
MSIKRFEVIEHTADWALRVVGHDLEWLLIHAAQGMNSLLVADPDAILAAETRQFELDAYDAESLLVEWLTELAYWAEAAGLVFTEFALTAVSPTHLSAIVKGGTAVELQKHIKAVTYHNLEILQTDEGLEATIVFDV